MANNLFADVPAACVAKQTVDFATAGFDSTNTRIIYEVGSPLKSYVPGRAINAVTSFTTGKGYYIVPKLDMDKSSYLAPPLPTGGGTQLNAPTGVTLGTATNTTQPLTWTDTNTSPNENSYKVYKNTTNNFGTATLVTTTAADATSYTVTGLTASTLYYYWIVAAGNGTTTSDSPASAVVSGSTASGGPTLADFGFTSVTGITESPSTVWNGTLTGTPQYQNLGLSNKYLAAANDGYIEFQYVATDAESAVMGFTPTNAQVGYAATQAGMSIYSGQIYKDDNGTITNTGVSIATGNWLRLNVVGSVIKIQKSTDHSTWTDVVTLGYTRTTDLHIVCNIDQTEKIYYPKGYNLS